MKANASHIPDSELLQLADGELSSHRSASLRAHMSTCAQCESRLTQIEQGLAKISTAYRDMRPETGDASGPRALLRARLAEDKRGEPAIISRLPAMLTKTNLALVCLLMLASVIGFEVLRVQARGGDPEAARPLPDPRFTPGAIRQANLADLCAINKEQVVREVPAPIEQKVFREYGIRHEAASDFEMDYLITPGLGGSDDLTNLWPEPHSNTQWNSYVKDQLEDRLHRMVCEREIPLEQAQQEIASNWISAYKKYFKTDQPVASGRPAGPTEIAALR